MIDATFRRTFGRPAMTGDLSRRGQTLSRTKPRAILALRFALREFHGNETQGGQVGAQAANIAAVATKIVPRIFRQALKRRNSESLAAAVARHRHAACRRGRRAGGATA